MRVESVDESLEVFEVGRTRQAELLGARSDPLAAQIVWRMVVPAVALGVVGLGGFRVRDRMEAQHVYIRRVTPGLYAACM